MKISFLDVLLMRCNGKLETNISCKETNNDRYLHWRSSAPMNDNLLWGELHHTEKSFTEFNGYPKWLLKQTLDSFDNKYKKHNNNINN